jgi:NAD(P)-dependent dehydrogenase (short-subunit alcohol dehydrogenase family)
VLVGRSQARAEATAQEIQRATGNPAVDFLLADLSILTEVCRLADDFKRRHDRLDVLVNNAGAYFTTRQESAEGYEMTLALNHLSPFLLTHLLLDVLQASAPARIVTVSSDAHRQARIDFGDLQSRKGYRGFRAYSRSKLMNVLFTYELARRLAGTGVTANALHPGFVASNFGRNNGDLAGVGMAVVSACSRSARRRARGLRSIWPRRRRSKASAAGTLSRSGPCAPRRPRMTRPPPAACGRPARP